MVTVSIEQLERELAALVHEFTPEDRPVLDRVLTRLALLRAGEPTSLETTQ